MKQFVRQITHWLYTHVVKPILFKRKPDGVHKDLVAMTKFVQNVLLLRELPRLWNPRGRVRLDDGRQRDVGGSTKAKTVRGFIVWRKPNRWLLTLVCQARGTEVVAQRVGAYD